jgi:hypothetical protein
MILTERDVFVGAHLTFEQKEALRTEAARRKISMSALIAHLVEEWLIVAPDEQVDPVRSNKRDPVEEALAKEVDVPLPLDK